MELLGPNLKLLIGGMDAALLRQRLAAQNLANIDTPGYKAGRVVFESRLQAVLADDGVIGATTHPTHLPLGRRENPLAVRPQLAADTLRSGRADGNTVDLEVESAGMAANELWYATMVRLANDEFRRLHLALGAGRS